MGCEALRRMLESCGEQGQVDREALAAHIGGCPLCALGVERLAVDLFADGDALSCEGAQALFPVYYEATQVEGTLLQTLTARERLLVALHLGSCPACCQQFEALCALSQAEERGEL